MPRPPDKQRNAMTVHPHQSMERGETALEKVFFTDWIEGIYCVNDQSGRQKLPIIDDSRPHSVVDVDLFMEQVAKTDEPLFFLTSIKDTSKTKISYSLLGIRVLMLLNANICSFRERYLMYQGSPYADVFVCLADKWDVWKAGRHIRKSDRFELEAQLKKLNGFVAALRNVFHSPGFKTFFKNFRRLPQKNYHSLTRYFNELFRKQSNLLVLRIEFSFGLIAFKKNKRPDPTMTYYEIKRRWGQFLKLLQQRYLRDTLTGFAWKLGYSVARGYYYHVLFLLNGSEVHNDVLITHELGALWEAEFTEGRAAYYNCKDYGQRYKQCGIGMIRRTDKAARQELEAAAFYMTQSDHYIRLMPPGNGRSFGKGCLPKEEKPKPRHTRIRSIPIAASPALY